MRRGIPKGLDNAPFIVDYRFAELELRARMSPSSPTTTPTCSAPAPRAFSRAGILLRANILLILMGIYVVTYLLFLTYDNPDERSM